jgi:hypothetical protein
LHVNGNFKAEGSVVSGSGGDIISGNHIVTTATHGRLGIGINSYSTTSIVHLHRTTANTEVKLQFTDGTTLSTETDGLTLYKGTNQIGYLWNYENADLAFGTNNSERMRIDSNGNIGIGTTVAPSNSLAGTPQLAIGSIGYGISGDNSDVNSGIYIGDGVVGARWKIVHGSYHLNLHQNNGSGTYNYRGAFANNTGTYSSVSDKRLKKNIEPIQYGLKDVLKFKPVSYFMENQNEDIDKKNLGFLAQDIEDIVPEIVNIQSSNDSNYIYSLQYSSIIPILIKAIQELNEIVLHNNTSNLVNV